MTERTTPTLNDAVDLEEDIRRFRDEMDQPPDSGADNGPEPFEGISEDVLPPIDKLRAPAMRRSYAEAVLDEVQRARSNVEAAIAFYTQQRDTVLDAATKQAAEFQTQLDSLRAALRKLNKPPAEPKAPAPKSATKRAKRGKGGKASIAKIKALHATLRKEVVKPAPKATLPPVLSRHGNRIGRPPGSSNQTPTWQRAQDALKAAGRPMTFSELSEQLGIANSLVNTECRRYEGKLFTITKPGVGKLLHVGLKEATTSAAK